MSCAAYDTLQCSIVATISNDVFRNKLNLWWVRLVLIVNVPAVVVATKNLVNVVIHVTCQSLIKASSAGHSGTLPHFRPGVGCHLAAHLTWTVSMSL